MPKRDRQCGNKTRHATKAGACVEADKALDVGMNVYRCPKCKSWHVGKANSPTRASDRIGALLARHERRLSQGKPPPSTKSSAEVLKASAERFAPLMKRLAER